MRPSLAVIVLLLLVPSAASAQAARGTPSEIAAQAVGADTSRMLALYMTQLAASGTPPTQADIDEAARQYLTNGAAVAAVPTSGPGAAYFQNGAAVTGVPTSGPGAAYFQNGAEVTAYRAPVAAPPSSTGETGAGTSAGQAQGTDAAAPVTSVSEAPAVANPPPAEPATTPSEVPVTSSATGLICPPGEIQAAMAIASQFATAAVAAPAEASYTPAVAPPAPVALAGTAPVAAGAPASACPAPPAVLSRMGPALSALGGVLFGGLAVVLGSRIGRVASRDARG